MAKTKRLITMAAALIMTASCSIKEDRSPCPCWLSIDLSRCPQMSVTVAAWADEEIFSEKVVPNDYKEPGSYEKTVPKGWVNTSVVTGEREMLRDAQKLIIPLGHDADSIYAHAGSIECIGEFANDTAMLHKQFARVFMNVEIPHGHEYPYSFVVSSDVCGMDMRDLSPVEGEFCIDLTLGDENICMFCLPRQKEDGGDLKMLICDQDELIETVPLAEWISQMGYNWLKKDLDDIYIGVDYAKAEVSISIKGWDDGYSFKVEI